MEASLARIDNLIVRFVSSIQTRRRSLTRANDQEQGNYIHDFIKQDWLDARHYNLCMDTSEAAWEIAVGLAENACVQNCNCRLGREVEYH